MLLCFWPKSLKVIKRKILIKIYATTEKCYKTFQTLIKEESGYEDI